MDDLHALPKIRDSLSHLYAEHCRIDRHDKAIALQDADGAGFTAVPVAALSVLMLGPGTAITHAAVQTLADNNCLVVWCGEENVRFYACGTGGTRSAANLHLQAKLVSDPMLRLEVVRRMYLLRFGEPFDKGDTVESLRGKEGFRMREAYAAASRAFGVAWEKRNYDRTNWRDADPVNRALSCANSCLYGLCHAAILASGFSPGLGFIHCGKQLSFVYDIADLYKAEVTIPVAFRTAALNPPDIERTVRLACRDQFKTTKLLSRIVPDIQKLLAVDDDLARSVATQVAESFASDNDPALPTELWTPDAGVEQAYQEQIAAVPEFQATPIPRSKPLAKPKPVMPEFEDDPFSW